VPAPFAGIDFSTSCLAVLNSARGKIPRSWASWEPKLPY
jgi:hypothetical protein